MSTIKLRQSCEQFKKVVGKEISDIQEMALKEIPDVLMKYPENEGEYHPSC